MRNNIGHEDAPKFSLKMVALPLVLFFQKRIIDFNNPESLLQARTILALITVVSLIVLVILYKVVEWKSDKRKIWVPPAKQEVSMPFLPKPEPPKPSEFIETTYELHEKKVVFDAIKSIGFASAIAFFISFKFSIHMSVLMQLIMIPMNVWDCPVFQRQVMGNISSNTYNELFSAPEETAAGPSNDDDDDDNVPRVEELPDEDDSKVKKEATGLRQRKENASSNSHDID